MLPSRVLKDLFKYTVPPGYNVDGGVHRADCVIAKPPLYKEGAFNIHVEEKFYNGSQGAHCTCNCNKCVIKGSNVIKKDVHLTFGHNGVKPRTLESLEGTTGQEMSPDTSCHT